MQHCLLSCLGSFQGLRRRRHLVRLLLGRDFLDGVVVIGQCLLIAAPEAFFVAGLLRLNGERAVRALESVQHALLALRVGRYGFDGILVARVRMHLAHKVLRLAPDGSELLQLETLEGGGRALKDGLAVDVGSHGGWAEALHI